MSTRDIIKLRNLLAVALDVVNEDNTSVIEILNKIKSKEKVHEKELLISLKSLLNLDERDLELFVIEDKEGILDIYSRYIYKNESLVGGVALSN